MKSQTSFTSSFLGALLALGGATQMPQPMEASWRGSTPSKRRKGKAAGSYSRGLQNAWNRKRQLRMAKLHPLRDEYGAFTLTGGRQDYIEIGPDGDFRDAYPGPRRIWLAGISAQRGY
jgi:hypothetical protein